MANWYAMMLGMADELHDELKSLGASYRRAHDRYKAAQKDLIGKIPDWIDGGIRQSEIVRETGLTREYIRQIVERRNKARSEAVAQAAVEPLQAPPVSSD